MAMIIWDKYTKRDEDNDVLRNNLRRNRGDVLRSTDTHVSRAARVTPAIRLCRALVQVSVLLVAFTLLLLLLSVALDTEADHVEPTRADALMGGNW